MSQIGNLPPNRHENFKKLKPPPRWPTWLWPPGHSDNRGLFYFYVPPNLNLTKCHWWEGATKTRPTQYVFLRVLDANAWGQSFWIKTSTSPWNSQGRRVLIEWKKPGLTQSNSSFQKAKKPAPHDIWKKIQLLNISELGPIWFTMWTLISPEGQFGMDQCQCSALWRWLDTEKWIPFSLWALLSNLARFCTCNVSNLKIVGHKQTSSTGAEHCLPSTDINKHQSHTKMYISFHAANQVTAFVPLNAELLRKIGQEMFQAWQISLWSCLASQQQCCSFDQWFTCRKWSTFGRKSCLSHCHTSTLKSGWPEHLKGFTISSNSSWQQWYIEHNPLVAWYAFLFKNT